MAEPPTQIPWDTPSGNPWRSLVDTVRECLLHPLRFFALVPNSSDRWSALGYAVLLHLIGFSFGAVWSSLFQGSADLFALVRVLIAPLWVLATVWLGSEMMHGLLVLLRGTTLPRTMTHRAVAYCYSTAALGVIPVVGLRLGLLAALVYQVIALWKTHQTRLWKAVVVVLLTWLILLGLVVLAAGGLAPDDES